MIFRSLLKNSSVTKEKALAELQEIVSKQPDIVDSELHQQWVLIYSKLAIDISVAVRTLAHRCQGVICKTLGKKAQKDLNDVLGPWLCGLYDPAAAVARAAQDALQAVFATPEKRSMLWKIYRKDLVAFINDAIVVESATSLYDERYVSKSEAELSYYRVVYTAIKALTNLLARTKNDGADATSSDDLDLVLGSDLWKYALVDNIQVQKTAMSFIRGLTIENEPLAEEHLKDLSSALLKLCAHSKKQSGAILPDILSTATVLSKAFGEKVWTSKKSKAALEVLFIGGSRESGKDFWKAIPALYHSLPDSLRPSEEVLVASASKENISAIIVAACECLMNLFPNVYEDVSSIVCLSNARFDLQFLFRIGKSIPETSSFEELVKRSITMTLNEARVSSKTRQTPLEKVFLLLQSSDKTSLSLSRFIHETLKHYDVQNFTFIYPLLKSKSYVIDEQTAEIFNKSFFKDTAHEFSFEIFSLEKNLPKFEDYLVELSDRLISTKNYSSLKRLFSIGPSLKGVSTPISSLDAFIEHHHSLEEDSNVQIEAVLSHDILISKQSAFIVLEDVVSDLEVDSKQSIKVLNTIASQDTDILKEFSEHNNIGKTLYARLFELGNETLLNKLSGESSAGQFEMMINSMDYLSIHDLGDMVAKAKKFNIENISTVLKSVLPSDLDVKVPIAFAAAKEQAILLDTHLVGNSHNLIDDQVWLKLLLIAEIAFDKQAQIEEEELLKIALISELCSVKQNIGAFDEDQQAFAQRFIQISEKLVDVRHSELTARLLSDSTISSTSFYHSLVLERLLEHHPLEPSQLASALSNRSDFVSFIAMKHIGNEASSMNLKNRIACQLIGAKSASAGTALLSAHALLSLGDEIPMNRVGMIIQSVGKLLQSDDAYETEFLPVRIALTYLLKSIVDKYSKVLLPSHWSLTTNTIEENFAVLDEDEKISCVLWLNSLKLLLAVAKQENAPESFDEKRSDIFIQAVDSIGFDDPFPSSYTNFIAELSSLITNDGSVFAEFDSEKLYGVLSKTTDINIMISVTMLCCKHVRIYQEDISIEYELSKGQMAVSLPDTLMSLVQEPRSAVPIVWLRQLATWFVIFTHFEKSSYGLRKEYIKHIQASLDSLLDKLFSGEFGQTKSSMTGEFDLGSLSSLTFDNIGEFSQHIYFLAIKYVPSVVRGWFLSQRNIALCKKVQEFTKDRVSPFLITEEISSLQVEDEEGFRIEKKSTSVAVYYQVDEEEGALSISFPESYPLEDITISTTRLIGISQKRWRGWCASMRASSMSHNGRLTDLISILKKSIATYFEGVEECAICYAVVHSDLTLPEKTCSTCKKKFHTDCLYRWFKSSNDSACPLCRAKFNFKTRQNANPLLV